MKTTNEKFDAPPGQVGVSALSWVLRGLACLVVFGVFPQFAGHSQVPQYNGGLPGIERNSSGLAGLPETANPRPDGVRALRDSLQQQDVAKRLKELNVQRQKDMTSDTVKLLELATQLDSETRKSESDKLSILQIRQAEMIEKLAKSVREKMSSTVGN